MDRPITPCLIHFFVIVSIGDKNFDEQSVVFSCFLPEIVQIFLGFFSGGIYLANAESCREIFTVDSPVRMLLFYEKKDILLILNTNLTFVLCHVKLSGQAEEIRKVCYIYK